MDGWVGVKVVLRIAYSNKKASSRSAPQKSGGWVGGLMDGWVGVKPFQGLLIAITN